MPTIDLRGVYNIAPTPFLADGAVDLASIRRLCRFLVDLHVDGITILGVLGEADKLTEAERDSVIVTFLEATDGRVPVCVGSTHPGTDGCVALSRRAQQLGAQALLVAPPRLARPNDAALRRHYLAVAEAVEVPVIVQDHPASSGVYMSLEFLAGLIDEAPLCRHVKLEDEPSPPKIAQLLEATPRAVVFGGLGGNMLLEELRRGAVGTMTGFAFPEILIDIHRRYTAGDHDGARDVFYRYCPLIRFENQPRLNLALRKHVYVLRGAIACDRVRMPALPLDAGTRKDLTDLLVHLHLWQDETAATVT